MSVTPPFVFSALCTAFPNILATPLSACPLLPPLPFPSCIAPLPSPPSPAPSQITVDVFAMAMQYTDLASLAAIPRYTCGEVSRGSARAAMCGGGVAIHGMVCIKWGGGVLHS